MVSLFFFSRRTLSVVVWAFSRPVKAVDCCHTEHGLISIDSHCQHSSALLPMDFFFKGGKQKNSFIEGSYDTFHTLSHSLRLHRRQTLSSFLSLHFLRQSRSLLATDQSRSEALFSVNVLAVAVRTLLPVKCLMLGTRRSED